MESCVLGWIEKHLFWKVQGVNVSKVVLWYQNTVYEIRARSVRCEDGCKFVEVLEGHRGQKIRFSIFFLLGVRTFHLDGRILNLVSDLKSDNI